MSSFDDLDFARREFAFDFGTRDSPVGDSNNAAGYRKLSIGEETDRHSPKSGFGGGKNSVMAGPGCIAAISLAAKEIADIC